MAGIVSRHPRESVALFVGSGAMLIICANALFMQPGPHPAPIFAPKPILAAPAAAPMAPAAAPLFAPPIASQRFEAPARPRTAIISDIQRELTRRQFYDGSVDGIWGAQTDAAARDFAQAGTMKITVEPGEELLRAITGSNVKASKSVAVPPLRNDPIAQLLAPGKRVVTVQRVLAAYGYGQIRPSGNLDEPTQAAIRKFELSRKMPATGQISDQLVRALSEMSGQPID
jgi:peptidoglycan hydrolase-like protein with peptidoglycan-binding domain